MSKRENDKMVKLIKNSIDDVVDNSVEIPDMKDKLARVSEYSAGQILRGMPKRPPGFLSFLMSPKGILISIAIFVVCCAALITGLYFGLRDNDSNGGGFYPYPPIVDGCDEDYDYPPIVDCCDYDCNCYDNNCDYLDCDCDSGCDNCPIDCGYADCNCDNCNYLDCDCDYGGNVGNGCDCDNCYDYNCGGGVDCDCDNGNGCDNCPIDCGYADCNCDNCNYLDCNCDYGGNVGNGCDCDNCYDYNCGGGVDCDCDNGNGGNNCPIDCGYADCNCDNCNYLDCGCGNGGGGNNGNDYCDVDCDCYYCTTTPNPPNISDGIFNFVPIIFDPENPEYYLGWSFAKQLWRSLWAILLNDMDTFSENFYMRIENGRLYWGSALNGGNQAVGELVYYNGEWSVEWTQPPTNVYFYHFVTINISENEITLYVDGLSIPGAAWPLNPTLVFERV
ncbi:MAG: hypothetical protein FWB72_04585 [Firmicutes bacterium]|nr:hypothetical protein [Bacillota bacterium]